MTIVPLARYLTDFGREEGAGAARAAGIRSGRDGAALAAEEAAAREQAAHARGFEEGKAQAEAAAIARLRAQVEDFEQRLAAERARWAESEGAVIADKLMAGLRELEDRVGEAAAHVLEPFLGAQVRKQAIDELVIAVRTLLGKSEAAKIEVAGPDDLLVALRQHLADVPNVTYSAASGADARITAGQTILETCIGAWAAKLGEARP